MGIVSTRKPEARRNESGGKVLGSKPSHQLGSWRTAVISQVGNLGHMEWNGLLRSVLDIRVPDCLQCTGWGYAFNCNHVPTEIQWLTIDIGSHVGFPKPDSICKTGFSVLRKAKTGFRFRSWKSHNCVHCKSAGLIDHGGAINDKETLKHWVLDLLIAV